MMFTYIKEITVIDPDSGGEVEVEIWKCQTTGGIFGVDASFMDQVGTFHNPFTGVEINTDSLVLP